MSKVQTIMEQAQAFASAWSLACSSFDQVDELENAEAMKSELRGMIESQAREIERLKLRLEIDPNSAFDGISCRNETIRLRDISLKELQSKNEHLHAVLLKVRVALCGDRDNEDDIIEMAKEIRDTLIARSTHQMEGIFN